MRLDTLNIMVMILSLFFVLTGCSIFAEPVKSFEGYFISVEEGNELIIDCSSAAKRNDDSGTEEGYDCLVEVAENTTIKTENGQKLGINDLNEWKYTKLDSPKMVRVILAEEKNINKNDDSRKGLKAFEIILLN